MIIYNGPSLIDGQPIVVIALSDSTNVKTGNMVQTYIIRADMDPMDATRTGDDSSVCGNCPHRWFNKGSCYVTVFRGPKSVYKKYIRGGYKSGFPDVSGRMVRIGTYGDPMAVPAHIWETLLQGAKGHTGYSHQWNNPDLKSDDYKSLVMASVDNDYDVDIAKAKGLRYFKIRREGEDLNKGEFKCPAEDKKKTCIECGACDGTRVNDTRASPAITVHGARKGSF